MTYLRLKKLASGRAGIWIQIDLTLKPIPTPLHLCCQCGGDNTLIGEVPVKRLSLYHHHSLPTRHRSLGNAFAPSGVVRTSTCCTACHPPQQGSVSWRWAPQPLAHRSSWSLLGSWQDLISSETRWWLGPENLTSAIFFPWRLCAKKPDLAKTSLCSWWRHRGWECPVIRYPCSDCWMSCADLADF